jgi:hypothetical protein
MIVSLKRLLIVLGLMFASTLLAQGQSIEHRLTFTRPAGSMLTTLPQRPRLPAAPSVLQVQDFRDHNLSHDDHNFAGSSLFQETKTPFMTESRMPIAQAFGSRLQVNFFTLSTINKNIVLGPLALAQSTQALVQPRFGDLYGIGVSIPFGRDRRSGNSQGLWRGVSRVLHGR